ncbi:MAG: hypothetical protein AAF789_12070 [Bacteroidota bacterium]
MKLIFRLLVIGAVTYFLLPYLPWWTVMIVCFLVCSASPSSGLNAFVAGFLGVGLVWLGQSLLLDATNQGQFSSKIALLVGLGDPVYLMFLSGLVGAIAGGFSSLAGTYFRQLFTKKKSQSIYS